VRGSEKTSRSPTCRTISCSCQQDYLVFCSGHFISYEGDKCERLHGHNYRAAIEGEGVLDENFYVFDFITLRTARRPSPTSSIIA